MELIVQPEVENALSPTTLQGLNATIREVFEALECEGEGSVVLTDDEEIRELNLAWRGLDEATDVLSFALQEAETPDAMGVLGDIVVSVETAERLVASREHQERVAAELGTQAEWTLLAELAFLIIHGALHLIGHDHAEPEEEALMRAEERRLFALVSGHVGFPELHKG